MTALPDVASPSLLFSYRRCPYAMRARMALPLSGLPFRVHDIVLRDKPAALLSASPKGTVPVLVQPGGNIIDESLDIMAWALKHPRARAHARDWWQRAQEPPLPAWIHTNDTAFKHHLDRYKYPERHTPPGEDPRHTAAVHREAAVDALLGPLEAVLSRHAGLAGEAPCAADLAVFPFVRQFAAIDPAWFGGLPLPGVQRWLKEWTHSPLFAACMIKTPAQTPTDMVWSDDHFH